MAFSSKQLLNILTFDSEECRILTLYERCLIHKEIARQAHGLPPKDFESDQLQELVLTGCIKIRQSGWVRPIYRYYEDNGQIKKEKTN